MPINIRKAPFFLDYTATYKSPLRNSPSRSKSPPSATTPTASSRVDQGSTSYLVDQPSTLAPSQHVPSSKRRRPSNAPIGRTKSKKHRGFHLLAYNPENPPLALLAFRLGTEVTIATNSEEIGHSPAVMAKAKVIAIPSDEEKDPKDTVPISKLAKAEKRPASTDYADAPPAKKPKFIDPRGEIDVLPKDAWLPKIQEGDQHLKVGNSAIKDLKVGAALTSFVCRHGPDQ
ncbi:hypothetical protein ACSBR2_008100 [Camellia fascicularis]